MGGRARAALGTAGLGLASLGLALVLAEALLRLWPGLQPAPPPGAAPLADDLPELTRFEDLVAPNQRGRYRGVLYETNRYRFRGPEPVVPKPAGRFRIVVGGDSVTMGDGVLAEDAYPAQLARALDDGSGRFEVLNLGVSGLNLEQILLKRLGPAQRFDPDLIVYGFTINDLEGLPGYRLTRRPARLQRQPFRLLQLLGRLWQRYEELRRLPGSYLGELSENYREDGEPWQAFRKDLALLAQLGRQQHACAVVLLHTHLVSLGRDHPLAPFYAQVQQAATREGLYVVPSLPYFAGRDPAQLAVSLPDNPHPNAEGHRLLAQALLDGLRALPAACWHGARPPPQGTARAHDGQAPGPSAAPSDRSPAAAAAPRGPGA